MMRQIAVSAFLCLWCAPAFAVDDGQIVYTFSVVCPNEYSNGFYVNWFGERRCSNADGNLAVPVDSGVLLTASFQCPRDLYTANVRLDSVGGTIIQCATGSGYQQGVGSLTRQPSTLQLYNVGLVVLYVVAFLCSCAVGFYTAGKPRGGILD
jgi:hypothetical protein